jgi:hypothetical protein
VDFHEHAVHARRHRRARQHRDKLRLASAHRGLIFIAMRSRRQLHRMRRVKHHRRELAHDGQRPHIHHQIVVAETRSTLGQKHLAVAGIAALCDRVLHVPGRNELPLLDVHRTPAQRRRHDQIGLPAEKCRNLQHVHDLRTAATSAT